jgi:hypothetical protein
MLVSVWLDLVDRASGGTGRAVGTHFTVVAVPLQFVKFIFGTDQCLLQLADQSALLGNLQSKQMEGIHSKMHPPCHIIFFIVAQRNWQ